MKISPGDVVVVTGASRGIGRETAIEFAKKGCRVALLARDEALLEKVKKEISDLRSNAMVVPCDVSVESECHAAIKKVVSSWGRVDILINNAGYGHYSSVEDMDTKSLEQIFKTNLFGAMWCIQAAIPFMKEKKRGHIVNISSIIGKRAFPFMSAYCSSKFALTALDESLGLELKPYKIGVSLVCPGYTSTEFQKNAKTSGERPNLRQQLGMKPARVAKAIVCAVRWNKRRTHLTADGRLLLFMNKISPSFVDFIFSKMFKIRSAQET